MRRQILRPNHETARSLGAPDNIKLPEWLCHQGPLIIYTQVLSIPLRSTCLHVRALSARASPSRIIYIQVTKESPLRQPCLIAGPVVRPQTFCSIETFDPPLRRSLGDTSRTIKGSRVALAGLIGSLHGCTGVYIETRRYP